MKTSTAVTLDVELLTYLRENKINVSGHLNELLSKWMKEKDGDVVPSWIIDNASGARYQLDRNGNKCFPNYDELHKFDSVRASHGKKVSELSVESKDLVLKEIQERTVKEGEVHGSEEEGQKEEEVKEGVGGGKDAGKV